MNRVKEMWCLVDSVGPTYKDYVDDLEEGTKVFLIVLKENPTLLLTVSRLIEKGCEVTLVFEQKSDLWKKYEVRYDKYKTAVIVDRDVLIVHNLKKFDYIIVDSDSIQYECMMKIEDKEILYLNHIPFRKYKGVTLDRDVVQQLKIRGNKIIMSQYTAYVYDVEGETLLNQESTIKVDLTTDRVESFECEDRSVKTYNITDYLEERKFRERKTNIRKQLPKGVAKENTRRKHS